MNNPGKYDDLCTMVREATQAEGVVLMIVRGNRGSGFSVQATPDVIHSLPDAIEMVVFGMRQEL